MAGSPPGPVREALDRWTRSRLLTPELADRLRAEAAEEAERSAHRRSRLALAGTGAVVLLIAAGVLGEWLWPKLGPGGRAIVMALVGVAVYAIGLRVERLQRWLPATYLLQTVGLGVLLGALFSAEAAWDRGTPGGIAAGIVALLAPVVTFPLTLRRNPVMPGMVLALGFGFLAAFLHLATHVSDDTIIWALDGVLGVEVVLVLVALSRPRAQEGADWLLNVFVMSLYVGLVLMLATAAGPLELEEDSLWAADVWLLVVTGLSLWGLHRAPPALQRDWFENQLALCVLASIPMGFATSLELLHATPEGAAALVGGTGVLGLIYAVVYASSPVLGVSSLTLVVAAWYYGVERAGALGAVLALAFTAALLIWLSVRLGRPEASD